MIRKGNEIIVSERDLKWWWFWLHPVDAMVFSHYGDECWDIKFGIPEHMQRALKHPEEYKLIMMQYARGREKNQGD